MSDLNASRCICSRKQDWHLYQICKSVRELTESGPIIYISTTSGVIAEFPWRCFRTRVAAERRISLRLRLQCRYPLLLRLQHTVNSFCLLIYALYLQLRITGTQFVMTLCLYISCSTSSSSHSSTFCLSSCYDLCSSTAWAARQQPCLSGEISPHCTNFTSICTS